MANTQDVGPWHIARLSLRLFTSGREEAGMGRQGRKVGKACM